MVSRKACPLLKRKSCSSKKAKKNCLYSKKKNGKVGCHSRKVYVNKEGKSYVNRRSKKTGKVYKVYVN
jgi:hypothetical protein